MKKGVNVFWGILLVCCIFFLIFACTMTPKVEASNRDVILYRTSGVSLLLIWIVGILIELDIFHIKGKIPLVKSSHIASHIGFWCVLLVVSVVLFSVFYNLTSQEFRVAMNEVTISESLDNQLQAIEEPNDLEVKKESTTEVATQMTEVEQAIDVVKEDDTKEDSIIKVEENRIEGSSAEPLLIENKTYYFDDAVYEVNGIQVTFESITLKRENKPEGYSVEVVYSLSNTNDFDSIFAFASQAGNGFIVDGKRAMLSTQSNWSKNHETDYHLKANESTDLFIGDFYALSNIEKRIVDGVEYEPVDLSDIYSNQKLTIELQIEGINNDNTENLVISFDIEL